MYVIIGYFSLELLHEQAHVFTSLSFGGGGACYGLISAQIANLMVINKMSASARRFALPSETMTPWPSQSVRMISLYYVCFFLWTITIVTVMKNTRTHARLVKQNLKFAVCWLTLYTFHCCVGGTIARASLCLHFTFGGACYRYLLVTVLSLNGCVDYINCTCNLLYSLDEYHHTCMVIFPCVFIELNHRQS